MKKLVLLLITLVAFISVEAQITPHIPLKPSSKLNYEMLEYDNDYITIKYPSYFTKTDGAGNIASLDQVTFVDKLGSALRVMTLDDSDGYGLDEILSLMASSIKQEMPTNIDCSAHYTTSMAGEYARAMDLEYTLYDMNYKGTLTVSDNISKNRCMCTLLLWEKKNDISDIKELLNNITWKDNRVVGNFNVEGNEELNHMIVTEDTPYNDNFIEVGDRLEIEAEPLYDSVQKDIKSKDEDKIYEVVDQFPSFPGGSSALMNYINYNKKYPKVAEENGVQGRVIVGFVVDKDGSIINVQVLKGVDPSLDREAERVVKSMPKWIPGSQNGRNVKVKYNVPVTFKLD